ncbi:MAG: YtxH domain-containing protein [Microgenomates group bacterium]
MSDSERGSESFLTGLVLGAILGAGFVYFLSSTKEGEKVKKRLRERSEDVLDNLADLIREIEEKGKEFKKKAKEVQVELEEKAAAPALSQIEKLRERGRRAVKFFTRNGKPLV